MPRHAVPVLSQRPSTCGLILLGTLCAALRVTLPAQAPPPEAPRLVWPLAFEREAVVSEAAIASAVGAGVLADGGNAVDAAVATAFALAVVHPAAGNIGGGGFLVAHLPDGRATAFDFRETAPGGATADMFLDSEGRYDPARHHAGALSVGVPGSVAGLHLAHSRLGKLPWARLVDPAVDLAAKGFVVSRALAESLEETIPRLRKYPASLAQFTRPRDPEEPDIEEPDIEERVSEKSDSKGPVARGGNVDEAAPADRIPLRPGDRLVQEDLARTLVRIRDRGPAGFYDGKTANLLVAEMRRLGGLIRHEDLRRYRAVEREPVRGTYRGFEVVGMPPPSSGGVAVIETLNILEGFDLRSLGLRGSRESHLIAEAMRRSFADRARHLGDPDRVEVPVARLISKEHAEARRRSIDPARASRSSPDSFQWPAGGSETTHLSVVDRDLMAVALTTTLEEPYGSAIVVPGAGFLLNNEMGDFNPRAGLTTGDGLIGTPANLVAPGKRMLSSMSPTIVVRDGVPALVVGSPGGRTIINTVILIIVNVVDHGLSIQEAIDAPRFHHQWLPDRILAEPRCFSPDSRGALEAFGHRIEDARWPQGSAMGILVRRGARPGRWSLEAGVDRRRGDGGAAGR